MEPHKPLLLQALAQCLQDPMLTLLTPEQPLAHWAGQCEAKQRLGPAVEPQAQGAWLVDVKQVVLAKAYYRHQLGTL